MIALGKMPLQSDILLQYIFDIRVCKEIKLFHLTSNIFYFSTHIKCQIQGIMIFFLSMANNQSFTICTKIYFSCNDKFSNYSIIFRSENPLEEFKRDVFKFSIAINDASLLTNNR